MYPQELVFALKEEMKVEEIKIVTYGGSSKYLEFLTVS
jgi:hypothetical protein